MKRTPAQIARFDHLCGRLFDGTLDDAEAREFNDLLEHGWLDEYERLAQLHATMGWQMRHQPSPASVSHGATEPIRRSWKPLAAAAAIVLSIGVIAALVLQSAWNRHERLTRPVEFYATLIDARGAVFGESDVPVTPGSQLPGGFLRLESGEVDVEFFSGARVTLTGPSTFGINSRMRGVLRSGSLAAYCPPSAKGFTIGAPGLVVVDLGTRFRMHVANAATGDMVQVHVLEGLVEATLTGAESGVKIAAEQVADFDARRQSLSLRPAPESVAGPAVSRGDRVVLNHDLARLWDAAQWVARRSAEFEFQPGAQRLKLRAAGSYTIATTQFPEQVLSPGDRLRLQMTLAVKDRSAEARGSQLRLGLYHEPSDALTGTTHAGRGYRALVGVDRPGVQIAREEPGSNMLGGLGGDHVLAHAPNAAGATPDRLHTVELELAAHPDGITCVVRLDGEVLAQGSDRSQVQNRFNRIAIGTGDSVADIEIKQVTITQGSEE